MLQQMIQTQTHKLNNKIHQCVMMAIGLSSIWCLDINPNKHGLQNKQNCTGGGPKLGEAFSDFQSFLLKITLF